MKTRYKIIISVLLIIGIILISSPIVWFYLDDDTKCLLRGGKLVDRLALFSETMDRKCVFIDALDE